MGWGGVGWGEVATQMCYCSNLVSVGTNWDFTPFIATFTDLDGVWM